MRESIRMKKDNISFKFRVAGIIIKDNKILLDKTENSPNYYLPGGYVELGETTKQALMRELKELVRRGIDLNCHYDEMSLKMLYLCNYKMKVALFLLYKQLNPFIEEVEEGFKSDVLIFQNELFSMINDGDFYDPDD